MLNSWCKHIIGATKKTSFLFFFFFCWPNSLQIFQHSHHHHSWKQCLWTTSIPRKTYPQIHLFIATRKTLVILFAFVFFFLFLDFFLIHILSKVAFMARETTNEVSSMWMTLWLHLTLFCTRVMLVKSALNFFLFIFWKGRFFYWSSISRSNLQHWHFCWTIQFGCCKRSDPHFWSPRSRKGIHHFCGESFV